MTTPRPDATQTVASLCALGPRRTGTDAERRAANALAEDLRSRGRKVAVESMYVHPHWPATHFLHCILAIAGSLLAGIQPAVGFALVLFAAASLYLDLNGRLYLLRRLFFRRASQNVVSPPLPPLDGEADDDTRRLVLTANYDAPLTGAAYNRWAVRLFETFLRVWPARTSPQAVIFWSIAFLVLPLGAQMAGLDGSWLAIVQLPPTMILIVAAFMLGEIGLSPPSPGANSNAAGVASAIAAADRLAQQAPANIEVHLLLCGAGESTREGARSFIRSHRKQLRRDRTWFLDLGCTGHGTPRFVAMEVPVLAQPADSGLAELAEALAEAAEDRGALALGPATGASLAAAHGYPSIALTAREGQEFIPANHHTPADLPSGVDGATVNATADFASDLVLLLDRDLGRQDA